MASRLQDLRREAGFTNQADFAAEIGVSVPTYARWEADPEKVPLKSAWELADRFGTSIDEIVGRSAPARVPDPLEGLSDVSRSEAEDFVGYLRERDVREAERARAKDQARQEQMASIYEDMMFARISDDPALVTEYANGTDSSRRAKFEGYVLAAAGESMKGDELRDYVAYVMEGWDRLHGSYLDEESGWRVFWSEEPRPKKALRAHLRPRGGDAGKERN